MVKLSSQWYSSEREVVDGVGILVPVANIPALQSALRIS